MKKPLLCLIALLLIAAGCVTVPITGRSQLSFVPYSELLSLGIANYKEIITKAKLSQDQEKVNMVNGVGRNVARSAELFMRENGMADLVNQYQWEFNLIEDEKTANAFCLPGGKIAVYTGILKYTQNKEGLATVIAHEVAHALANHGGERMSQLLLVELGGLSLSTALKQEPQKTKNLAMEVYGVGTTLGIILPYSRTHESEADRIGLILMARAGYNPEEAIAFWERMSKQETVMPIEFLSTHPAPARRIEDIRKQLPEAAVYYHKRAYLPSTN